MKYYYDNIDGEEVLEILDESGQFDYEEAEWNRQQLDETGMFDSDYFGYIDEEEDYGC